MQEEVLVFSAELLEPFLGQFDRGLLTGPAVRQCMDSILASGNLFYLDRASAEASEAVKQVIPYTVLFRGREVFRYQRSRQGGEGRLHDRHSIGVGGHINPADGDGLALDTYETAWRRELAEEVGISQPFTMPEPVALLYDDSSPVGRVHLGVVHFLQLSFSCFGLHFHDPALQGGHFEHATQLRHSADDFENWSRLLIDRFF